MSIFEERINLKPYEYPHLLKFKDAIREAYWIHTEFESEVISDMQDYSKLLDDSQKQIIARTMLAISQIEVGVKLFWADLYKHCPKPELSIIGQTFGDSEARHLDAYSFLLEIMGLDEEFEKLLEVPAIIDRINYLKKYHAGLKCSPERYTKSLFLFALFVEGVSLFGQFLILMSFNKHLNILKGIANIVSATFVEEMVHLNFGIELIRIIKEEHPDYFDDDFYADIKKFCQKAHKAEMKILSWIFESGELDFLPITHVDEFIKDRFNRSFVAVDLEPLFEVDEQILSNTTWLDEQNISSAHADFFHVRPTSYSKNNKSYTTKDLF